MRAFFFGMGYSSQAAALAIRELAPGASIAGTTRSDERIASLSQRSTRVHVFDGARPGDTLGDELRRSTHVVISIPPTESNDSVLTHHAADLDAAPDLTWLCYYSTVGVYGDFGGEWVDENAPTNPVNRRSMQRVKIEQDWRDYAARRDVPLTILRLAGIYGPGRSALDKLREGTARRIVKPGQVFNRIHVADIGRITGLAAQQRLAGTFNLADDEPAPPQEVIEYAARAMHLPVPPDIDFETADMTPMARSFYSDNKRVSNAAIKAALGVELLYPNYRLGLDALKGETS
jgi:nucleoside-diphosphate-sugar epimerase